MNVLMFLIPLAVGLGIFFVIAFIWATHQGQYDDVDTPAQRMLLDDNNINFETNKRKEDE